MIEPRLRDEPLTSEDLALFGIVSDKQNVARLASIIIELFRQGVRDLAQLKMLASATWENDPAGA